MSEQKKPLEVLIVNSKQDDRQEWLTLSTDAGKVQALFERLGIEPVQNRPRAAYYVAAAENLLFPELDAVIGKPNTIDGLNWLASRLETLDAGELAVVQAVIIDQCQYSVADVIDLTYNTEYYLLIPRVQTERELGHYYLYQSGMVDMPEEWKAGIELPAFGRHIMELENGHFLPQGYLIKSGDEWKTVCDKVHIPEEYRVEHHAYDNPVYVSQLPQKQQDKIKLALRRHGIDGKELDEAMNSRLCDLGDAIPIKKLLEPKKKRTDPER